MQEHANQLEISEMIAHLSLALDYKNMERTMEKFSTDAHFVIEEDGRTTLDLKGREAIREHLAKKWETMDVVFHNTGATCSQIITLDQAAESWTSAFVKTRTFDPSVTTDECVHYHDRLIKVDGHWYIVERTIEVVTKSVF